MTWKLAILLAAGCSNKGAGSPDSPVDTSAVSTGTPAIAVEGGVAGGVLVATVSGVPAGTAVDVDGGDDHRVLTTAGDGPERLIVPGLLPDTDYTVAVGGASASFSNGHPDSALCPKVEVLANDSARVAPGWTLAPYHYWLGGTCVVVLDEQARVRWWYVPGATDMDVEDAVVGPDGLLWMRSTEIDVRDWSGALVRHYAADPVDGALPLPTGSHHELLPQADGTFWYLGREMVTAQIPDDYGSSTTVSAEVDAHLVVHVDADGSELSRVDLLPLLESDRCGYEALTDRGLPYGIDFMHANAVVVLPDGRLLVSIRNQDVNLMLDAAGNVEWRFGDPAGWQSPFVEQFLTPIGDPHWPYHSHATKYDPSTGMLQVFDNHSDGGSPYDPDPGPANARITQWHVDEAAKTVEFVAQFDATTTGLLQSPYEGDDDVLDNGDILADFGWVEQENGVTNADLGYGAVTARIVEIDPSQPDSPALDLRLSLDPAAYGNGASAFRVQRIPSLADPE